MEEMRKGNRRNDSHNVSLALQHDPPESNNVKPKPGDHRGSDSAHKDKKQNVLELAGFGGDEGRTNSGEHAGGQMDDRWRMEEEERPSSCCKLDDLKRLSDCEENLGLIRFDGTHAVLVDVEQLYNCQRIVPAKGKVAWDDNHVKMPHATRNQMGPNKGPPKWKQISECLFALASRTEASAKDVEKAILHFNPKYRSVWTFDALLSFVKSTPSSENDLNKLFAKIAALALKLPEEVQKAIPLLQRGRSASITLSHVQISCLLANAFFCTFPHRNASKPSAEYHSYPSINFSSLFGKPSHRKIQKLKAIMHYFRVVTDEGADKGTNGLVTFERRCLRDEDKPCWESCREPLRKLHVTSEGNIEDQGADLLQVDFAAKVVGGGVLDSGLVQEEILFLLHPELIVSRLFTQELADNECLIVKGMQRFSLYEGYSDAFQWAGPYDSRVERDEWRRLKRRIVAIDALHFRDPKQQFHMNAIERELNKAYCGFKCSGKHQEPDIATGKWGCGAFNGDPQLKAVIQLMAAAKAGRGLAFFTFKDQKLESELRDVYHLLVSKGCTVGGLYKLLQSYCAEVRRHKHEDLFDFIRKSGSKL
ncbi:poly(ADP-ribose) glycohydrolase isoform X2 [Oryzias latipes]|uniref:poly(ADP-ribose) glycohydrolase isoform X2 n=1 Tax=Oryzias latipes TaxID=8090 RepID=UPI0005CB82BB|nr:poly(ADP-ribose) glycohydrolase isoform X2 [Oryzias latipes]